MAPARSGADAEPGVGREDRLTGRRADVPTRLAGVADEVTDPGGRDAGVEDVPE